MSSESQTSYNDVALKRELDYILKTAEEPIKVKVVIEGSAGKKTEDGKEVYRATGTATLITCGDFSILVDCGNPHSPIVPALSSVPDIVMITHWHTDHSGRLCDYIGAEIADSIVTFQVSLSKTRRLFWEMDYFEAIEFTNAHSKRDMILIIKGYESKDKIVICGDIFEDEDDYNEEIPKGPSVSVEAHKHARDVIRKLDPYIVIPGHGKPFLCRKSYETFVGHCADGLRSVCCKQLTASTTHPQYIIYNEKSAALINATGNIISPEHITDVVVLKPHAFSARYLGDYPNARVYMSDDVYSPPDIYEPRNGSNQPMKGDLVLTPEGFDQWKIKLQDQPGEFHNSLVITCGLRPE